MSNYSQFFYTTIVKEIAAPGESLKFVSTLCLNKETTISTFYSKTKTYNCDVSKCVF